MESIWNKLPRPIKGIIFSHLSLNELLENYFWMSVWCKKYNQYHCIFGSINAYYDPHHEESLDPYGHTLTQITKRWYLSKNYDDIRIDIVFSPVPYIDFNISHYLPHCNALLSMTGWRIVSFEFLKSSCNLLSHWPSPNISIYYSHGYYQQLMKIFYSSLQYSQPKLFDLVKSLYKNLTYQQSFMLFSPDSSIRTGNLDYLYPILFDKPF